MTASVREARLERCARLLGPAAMDRLAAARVLVVGLGGVGSYCAEALARSGVGTLVLVDHDVVSPSNCNRQLEATSVTLGQPKVEALGAHLLAVAPTLRLELRRAFFAAETADELLTAPIDAVVDAIDSLSPKVELLHQCQRRGLFVVSALGAGGRVDPTRIRLVPLVETRGDPLALQVRKHLRRRGTLDGVMAAYTQEPPRRATVPELPAHTTDLCRGRQRLIQPSLVMVPAAMGMAIAAHVVLKLADAV